MEIFGTKYDIEKILVILITVPFALVALAYAILFVIFSFFSL
jgi:flagellar basal body-associated protein FliL